MFLKPRTFRKACPGEHSTDSNRLCLTVDLAVAAADVMPSSSDRVKPCSHLQGYWTGRSNRVNVLIRVETGTGKDDRPRQFLSTAIVPTRLVRDDCAAIPVNDCWSKRTVWAERAFTGR